MSRSRSPASRGSTSPAATARSAPAPAPGPQTSIPVARHQHRHRAGRRDRARRHGADRLEDHLRAEDDRAHRARAEPGSAGAGHPARQGDRRRLSSPRCAPPRAAKRPRPNFRVTVTTSTMWGIAGVGIIGDRAAGHGRRGGEVRPAMSEPVIEAHGLTKRYGSAIAVDDVSFTIAPGEIFGLLGPNGAGKTTTILMMLGLTEISAGAGTGGRARSGARAARGQAAGRLPAGRGRLLRPPDRSRQPALHGAPDRPRARRARGAHRRRARPRAAHRRRRQAGRDVLARHAPAARARRDPHEGRARSRSSTSRPPASIRRRPSSSWR